MVILVKMGILEHERVMIQHLVFIEMTSDGAGVTNGQAVYPVRIHREKDSSHPGRGEARWLRISARYSE